MKILLLQNMLYVPSFGGANRANRCLLEKLAQRGHKCEAIVPVIGAHGPQTVEQFLHEIRIRNHDIISLHSNVCIFMSGGVEVHAVFSTELLHAYAANHIHSSAPDVVMVSSQDPGQVLLTAALENRHGRVVYVVHALWDLPFGPHALFKSSANTKKLKTVDGIITVSNYVKNYIRHWSGLESEVIAFPVYGDTSFSNLASFDQGHITLINPSAIKGISIFEYLARNFPEDQFATVPTWATTDDEKHFLEGVPNVKLWPPVDEIEIVLAKTKVLLVPSLVPEAFGLIVMEAMLRGLPVIASDAGGLTEAKLGVDYVLPVNLTQLNPERFNQKNIPESIAATQDLGPWQKALQCLIRDREHYNHISRESQRAALAFVANVSVQHFEAFFENRIRNNTTIFPVLKSESRSDNPGKIASQSPIANISSEKRAFLALRALKSNKKRAPEPDGS